MLGIDTIITLYFNELGTNTELTIDQSGIPTNEIENMKRRGKKSGLSPCVLRIIVTLILFKRDSI